MTTWTTDPGSVLHRRRGRRHRAGFRQRDDLSDGGASIFAETIRQMREVLGIQLQSSELPDRLRVHEAVRLFAHLPEPRAPLEDGCGGAQLPRYVL